MTKYNVLSIDAWAASCFEPEHTEDNCDCNLWEWNAWHNAGTYHESEYGELTENSAWQYFADRFGASLKEIKEKMFIDDDGYNYVLCQISDNQPFYAIEYGGAA